MPDDDRIAVAFQSLAIRALRGGHSSPGVYSEVADVVPFDHPRQADYDEAIRLLRNVGRGIALQRGRGDAAVVWAVTLESVTKLQAPRYRMLLTLSVVELLDAMCAEAEQDAAAQQLAALDEGVLQTAWYAIAAAERAKRVTTRERNLRKALDAMNHVLRPHSTLSAESKQRTAKERDRIAQLLMQLAP